MADLKPGWLVVGNDGNRVGSVREVGQNYLLTKTSALAHDLYIPASAIANVQQEIVHLSVRERDVADMGWEQPPRDTDAPTAPEETDLHRHI